nr:MAG TPA: hypothetical protein [Caudoviricetes sp.]
MSSSEKLETLRFTELLRDRIFNAKNPALAGFFAII